ncbi:MAG TPA: tetratricopeptide repeat protein [Polyangiaceae bacterium]|jgi:TolA-binding protein
MKAVDIHPEELIDKLADGSLTLAQRERLDAHLAQCASCRFEIAVRADLTEDAPAIEQRPQLTIPGSATKVRALGLPHEQPAARGSRSLRVRARRRWPLSLLAAALVLCAGGAMAAVITGAVGAHWPHWSPEPKPTEPSPRATDAKPAAKARAAIAFAAPAPASEASPSSVASVPTLPAEASARSPLVAVASRSTSAPASPPAHSQHVEAALALPADARGVAVGSVAAVSAVPAARSSAEASATRIAPAAVTPAAALFADANRARRDGNVDRAVGLYRALQNRYPSSSESELSRALLAQLLLDRGNPEAALAGFDRYLSADAPVLGAEALVGRARALEQLGKPTQAADAWRQVQSRFPGSVHARLAATRLAALGMQ